MKEHKSEIVAGFPGENFYISENESKLLKQVITKEDRLSISHQVGYSSELVRLIIHRERKVTKKNYPALEIMRNKAKIGNHGVK
ncbi:MAG: hypothetical protein CL843_09115 [Crocinitomicaceae bacterium]|nr:hypothetical protein [Crocinitomicaceae bacterium]|tara:strand:+ start:1038 stop:1289 length:252 start_codon:yes stop_codon:yes gene_type:complete